MLMPVYWSPCKGGAPFLFTGFTVPLFGGGPWLLSKSKVKGRAITGPPQVLGCWFNPAKRVKRNQNHKRFCKRVAGMARAVGFIVNAAKQGQNSTV